ncbi:hypothetical protein SRABI83_03695 [Arthrobacter sp. Bi83]|uniref:DUF6457 domain-containing protein n=1 Tax=Arthrobacter sp. Bi83 TaxID=2822353 RepID=UPI001D2FC43A|nr:DUF6457 domain-containing protein [Arthrobacter sp. Bi83]CAH0272781.1 hypothetical protein SRABI83_03695 [Arthrobacter sp. Bi83]
MTGSTEGTSGTGDTSEDQVLDQWSRRLTQALQILDLKVDHGLVRRLADESAQAVNGSAGPVSALLVGYAAGLAAQHGKTTPTEAVESAAQVVLQLCEHGADGGPDSKGWSSTAQ